MKKEGISIFCTFKESFPPSVESQRRLLGEGLSKNGIKVEYLPFRKTSEKKCVALWGWKPRSQFHRNMRKEVLCMERGYIGDRYYYTSLGWNGLNNYAEFPEYEDDGGQRFAEHGGVLKPWKKDGDYALILGQVYGDSSLRGENVKGWYENIAKEIKQFYNIPVYFRPHPLDKGMHQSIQNAPNLDGSLEESLSKALFTVAWNSNSCLDSIMAGIPCYAGDKGTMAWDLCMKSIDNLYYPEREAVCHRIAFTQWSPDEIESGTATRKLADRVRLYAS